MVCEVRGKVGEGGRDAGAAFGRCSSVEAARDSHVRLEQLQTSMRLGTALERSVGTSTTRREEANFATPGSATRVREHGESDLRVKQHKAKSSKG